MKEDIILFAKYNFHLSILNPISEKLDELKIPHLLTTKRYKIYDHCNEFGKAKIILLCDEWINLFRKSAEIIMTTGHSLVSKNTTFSPKNAKADYILVTSHFQKNEFISRKVIPRKEFLITGYPAADRLFRREERPSFWGNLLHRKRKRILFAPTYNYKLSLMPFLLSIKRNVIEKLSETFDIGFKLHPVLSKKYPDQIRQLLEIIKDNQNVFYYEDSHSDITDAILWSDLVVGDCSGALFLAIAGNKPVIAFDNPSKEQSQYYDPAGPEWRLRDSFCYWAKEIESIPIIAKEVFNGDPLKESRKSITKLVFGNSTDGKSAARIAMEIKKVHKTI